MDVFELINAVGAELVANKAIAKQADGTRVVVAHVVGDAMVLTAEGEAMAAQAKPEPKPAAKTAKSKTTKAAAAPTPEE